MVQWSRPLLPVHRFPCGKGLNLGWGRSWSDAWNSSKVVTSTWYSHITHTVRITVRTTVLYCTHSSLQRISLCSTPHSFLSISLTHKPHAQQLRCLGAVMWRKACPDPGNIRHYWWFSGQDLSFYCRGYPAATIRTSVRQKLEQCLKVLQNSLLTVR